STKKSPATLVVRRRRESAMARENSGGIAARRNGRRGGSTMRALHAPALLVMEPGMIASPVAAALVMNLAVTASAAESAAVAADAPIPVLIITGENNHDWKFTTPRIRQSLEESGRFLVDVTEKPAQTLADANGLAKYRALVLNYNGARWGEI